ncbi:hypothetical protein EVA_12551 [gut metagenome]|uniref:Uncharacterized protein n=1 Tax=gut metagenome TaxID=749906 RepID=J9FXQ9_9ZZZZ
MQEEKGYFTKIIQKSFPRLTQGECGSLTLFPRAFIFYLQPYSYIAVLS